MNKNYAFELRARKVGIAISDIECDELVFDKDGGREKYEALFDLSNEQACRGSVYDYARAIADDSRDVRVFALCVAGNGDIIIYATMDEVPGAAFSYPVRRDCSSSFTALYRPDEKNEFKFRFETSYRMTRITSFVKNSEDEWEEKSRLVVWPNGNSQLVSIQPALAH